MSYNADELFSFVKVGDGKYGVKKYLKADDPTITKIEVPAEYNGEPVQRISFCCFHEAKYLKRVIIPPSVHDIDQAGFAKCKSLETVELPEGLCVIEKGAFCETNLKHITLPKTLSFLGTSAFAGCHSLESVTFNSEPEIELFVFNDCPKLPPETVVIGLVRSTDITRSVSGKDIQEITGIFSSRVHCDFFRRDVFELLLKNDCLWNCNLKPVLYGIIKYNKPELYPLAEQYGMLESAELVDELIAFAAEHHIMECTAYLLDLKNKKFGFVGFDGFGEADNYEL